MAYDNVKYSSRAVPGFCRQPYLQGAGLARTVAHRIRRSLAGPSRTGEVGRLHRRQRPKPGGGACCPGALQCRRGHAFCRARLCRTIGQLTAGVLRCECRRHPLVCSAPCEKRASKDERTRSSSCATYGAPDRTPISETAPQRPINPYGRSKLMAETFLADCAAAYGFRVASLRYFNAAGADPDGELCERHDPETHLVPLAIMAATGRAGPLRIFGDDYPTPDGTCVRDFVHVTDLAEGHVRALAKLDAGANSLSINLGSGRGHSVKEVVGEVARASGREVPVEIGPRRQGDPPVLVADVSLAKETFGFEPRRSDLAIIVEDALHSFRLHFR